MTIIHFSYLLFIPFLPMYKLFFLNIHGYHIITNHKKLKMFSPSPQKGNTKSYQLQHPRINFQGIYLLLIECFKNQVLGSSLMV